MGDLYMNFLDFWCDLRGLDDYLVAIIELTFITFYILVILAVIVANTMAKLDKAYNHNRAITKKRRLKSFGHFLMRKRIFSIFASFALFMYLCNKYDGNLKQIFHFRKKSKYRNFVNHRTQEFIYRKFFQM